MMSIIHMDNYGHQKSAMLTLILTFFLDNVGLFMVVPIYAPLLLNSDSTLLSATAPYILRTVTIGLLVACYGVGQFFGGPLLGELSDQFGRKKIILIGLCCLIIGNILGGFSLVISNLTLLFICRFLTGFASGNWSVIFAAVTDMSKNKQQRNINLGYLTGAAALGAVIGPLIGARLSDSATASWFNYATPFLFMALAFIINFLLLLLTFKDIGRYQRRKMNFYVGLQNIYECLNTPTLRIILLSFFFFSISTESIFAGLPIFAVEKFKVSSVFLGDLIAVGSIVSAFSSIYLNKKFSKKFSSYWIFFVSMLVLAIDYFLFLVPSQARGLFIPYIIFGLSCILVWTHANSIIAGIASADMKGKVLGVTQSLLSLAIILGPTLIGIFAATHYNAPIIISAISGVLSLLLFGLFWQQIKTSLTP